MVKLTKRKGFNFFRSYYDVYNELPDKDKLAFMDALLDRQFIGVKPKNLKGMSNFAYISQTNSIDSQVKGYEDKTKTRLDGSIYYKDGESPINKDISPPTYGVKKNNLTPTLQVEEKEKEKEKVEDKKRVFNFRKSLLGFGFKENLVEDWLKVRKSKKATNSETAFNGFIKQVQLSKLDRNEILTECVYRSWTGFKAEWMDNKSQKTEKPLTMAEKMRIDYGIEQ
jgi:hypothetical protein